MKKVCKANEGKKMHISQGYKIMKPAIEKSKLKLGICQDQPC